MEKLQVDSKNVYMDSGNKIDLYRRTHNGMDKAERLRGNNGIYFHNGDRVHNTKMGEIAKSLGNILGWTSAFFAFLANLPNPVSFILGIGSAMFIYYRALKVREDMLIKRVERKEKEYDLKKKINGNH